MTTSTTDTFETIQQFDQSMQLASALARHMEAEKAAGIVGERTYSWIRECAGTRWTIKGAPVSRPTCPICCGDGVLSFKTMQECDRCGGTGVDPEGRGYDTEPPEDFPCCGPNGTGH